MNRSAFLTKLLVSAFLMGVVVAPGSVPAQNRDARGDATVNVWSRYADVDLEFDRTLYRVGDDIPVRFRVSNTGTQVLRIFPSNDPARTFQFMVTDKTGREIPMQFDKPRFQKRENGDRAVVSLQGDRSKEVILHPGETFEKRVFLNDFYHLPPGSEYRITGYYYPDARQNLFVRSRNTARLFVERPRGDLRAAEGSGVDSVPSVSPEETVYLFLSAEMRQNWTNHLKYIDLRKYLTAYDRFSARYVQATEEERPEILSEFSKYLTHHPADRLRRFRIISEQRERSKDGEILDNGRAFVKVQAEREANGYNITYEYTYTLEKASDADGFWRVVFVSARVLR